MQNHILAAALTLPVLATTGDVCICIGEGCADGDGGGETGGDQQTVDTTSPCDIIMELTGTELYQSGVSRAWEALNDAPAIGDAWVMYAAYSANQTWEWVDGPPNTNEAAVIRGELKKDPVSIGVHHYGLATGYRWIVTHSEAQSGVTYAGLPAQSAQAGDWTLYYVAIPEGWYPIGERQWWWIPKGNAAGRASYGVLPEGPIVGTVAQDGEEPFHNLHRFDPAEGHCPALDAALDGTGG